MIAVGRPFLLAVALGAVVGMLARSRAAWIKRRTVKKHSGIDGELPDLVGAGISSDLTVAATFALLSATCLVVALTESPKGWYLLAAMGLPVLVELYMLRYEQRNARLVEQWVRRERRAAELLEQTSSAPARWAQRLAPEVLPDARGYDIGIVHEPASGMMSGDLLDVFELPSGRLCCVVGDVSGHDVEASITALQVKFLLRSSLRRYRDPGQALEELNRQLVDYERPEEFVSLFVMVFDEELSTLRYASAGHPTVWWCRERVLQPLRETGPLLMMDPGATFGSREVGFGEETLVVVSTDGLLEARDGKELFGDEGAATVVRRLEAEAAEKVARGLMEAAHEFASVPIADDVTVLAVRRRGR
ncbi:MAG: PP2C family protein-serine/threonine phosphatase [Microthrixaceae bacterium]